MLTNLLPFLYVKIIFHNIFYILTLRIIEYQIYKWNKILISIKKTNNLIIFFVSLQKIHPEPTINRLVASKE